MLRDSLKGLVAGFQMTRTREEKVLQEAEEMGRRYVRRVEEVHREHEDGGSFVSHAMLTA